MLRYLVAAGLILAVGWVFPSVSTAQTVDQLLEGAVIVMPQEASLSAMELPAARSGDDLRTAAKDALSRSWLHGQAVTDEKSVRTLFEVCGELKNDTSLAAAERAELQRSVTQRLRAIAAQLRTRLPRANQHVLGQQFFPGQAPQQAQPQATNPAQDLMDVIQDTIAPTSWERVGGQGVIRFWGPGNALIIRQSSDVHQALAQLIADLHP